MIAPSSLTVALPACFPRASGGALLLRVYYIIIIIICQAPIFTFSGGEILFLQCFLHAHFSYYVRYIDTHI